LIPDLLWRCPLCASNDALRHSQRWLYPEVLKCIACGAQWRVRRVVGENYYLKITHSGRSTTAFPPGVELSITAWYDLMKQTVHLEALPDPQNLLETGEELYLASNQATLRIEAQSTYSRPDPIHPKAAGVKIPSSASLTGPATESRQAGLGQMFLTNRRMIWRWSPQTAKTLIPSADTLPFNLDLNQVDGIFAIFNLGLSIVAGMQLYYLRFAKESPLKWVTFVALIAPQVRIESGHRIQTSHY
jgi:hypothetical protein